jgi:hypothetical protein
LAYVVGSKAGRFLTMSPSFDIPHPLKPERAGQSRGRTWTVNV